MQARSTLLRMLQVGLLLVVGSTATPQQTDTSARTRSPVADDVLFLVLGKMSLYDQDSGGEISLRNHHFVAEIMPKSGRQVISGALTSATNPELLLEFRHEGNALLAHGARVTDPGELHQLHPDGEYLFTYRTQSGVMNNQPLAIAKRPNVDVMPDAAQVTARQNGEIVSNSTISSTADLSLSWEPMAGNTGIEASELDDLIFVLAFDCFGNNVAHSGRPYQGDPYLTYRDSSFVIPASALSPGLRYSVIVEQATADVQTFQGVPGIATYATLTFLEFKTDGLPAGDICPAR